MANEVLALAHTLPDHDRRELASDEHTRMAIEARDKTRVALGELVAPVALSRAIGREWTTERGRIIGAPRRLLLDLVDNLHGLAATIG